MAHPLLPAPEAFAAQAGTLVGKKLTVSRSAALSSADIRCVASYVDPSRGVLFLIATDLGFVASMGAALAMMPPGAASDALRAGKPSSALVENTYEVLNVAASLFNGLVGATAHVTIERLRVGPPAASLAALLSKPAARLDLDVTPAGYPRGRIALVALATPVSSETASPPRTSSAWMVWPPHRVVQ